ncbi:hypothetical protein P152DRAFT_218566 [Eremomyces bilateralis CBS 781.70]|uniref:TAFII55 protein conserved region domain-containing protein n=1 Tax=Eremomyces bilateralis CBS 781.70 TaxID=1392243 RepID=A0A6G1FRY3_9PEZI|nr:uncharacterized protein P152DRAFT_218566 [Eremomyces bilateralis CBS 781.70]KAF1808488.1 hypothetical protein P152DRAFT_218566 [Eremomyces bilateralis CBS 781.70]
MTGGSGKPTGLKLKLPKSQSAAEPESSSTPKLRLNFKGITTPATENPPSIQPSPEQPKPKRKYTKKPKGDAAPTPNKKRPIDDESSARPKKRINKASIAGAARKGALTPVLKLKSAVSADKPLPKVQKDVRMKIKVQGKPPERPIGVGYDSEDDEVEKDPAIEQAFIIRFLPNADLDYVRQCVQEKRVGLRRDEGGLDMHLRFFDREGRRAVVVIRKSIYAAVLVDLPCVAEGMKSWDRKGWYKSVDVYQMLLVLGPVGDEGEAKTYPLPNEVDPTTWQYAHGLTPPMHHARKRRFRQRVSFRTIEEVEEKVERLLEADKKAQASGGSSIYTLTDGAAVREGSDAGEAEDEDYGYGQPHEQEGMVIDEEMMEADVDDMAKMFEAEFEEDAEGEPADLDTVAVQGHAGDDGEIVVDADAAAAIASRGGNTAVVVEASPAADTGDDDDDDDDDDDADAVADEEDEDFVAAQQELLGIKEQITELENDVQYYRGKLDQEANKLLRGRLQKNIEQREADLEIKKREYVEKGGVLDD